MSRALLTAFPADHPRPVALLDVCSRTIETFVDEEIANLRNRLLAYDIIAADEHGYHVPDLDVQLARLALPHSTHGS